MDTEEDMPRPDELRDGTVAEVNALRDLLSQIGDPDAAHDAGVIDDDEYVERKARKLAYTSALAAYANGEAPDPGNVRGRPTRGAPRRPSRRRPRPTRRTSTTCS